MKKKTAATHKLPTKKFQRTKEDFTCEQCGTLVHGNGYTNHCPQCLWSKHVDVNPGDRRSTCGGLMKPATIEFKGGEYFILHQCVVCGFKKRNKTATNDLFDAIVTLSRNVNNTMDI